MTTTHDVRDEVLTTLRARKHFDDPTDDEIALFKAWNFLRPHTEWLPGLKRSAESLGYFDTGDAKLHASIATGLQCAYWTWCDEEGIRSDNRMTHGLILYGLLAHKIWGPTRYWWCWPDCKVTWSTPPPNLNPEGWDDDPFAF